MRLAMYLVVVVGTVVGTALVMFLTVVAQTVELVAQDNLVRLLEILGLSRRHTFSCYGCLAGCGPITRKE